MKYGDKKTIKYQNQGIKQWQGSKKYRKIGIQSQKIGKK